MSYRQLATVGDSQLAARPDLPCQHHDPELFFAEEPWRLEVAKQICTECPLRAECLAGALRRSEPHGVWGGEVFVGGVVVARKRPRGRPRKEAAPAEAPGRRQAA